MIEAGRPRGDEAKIGQKVQYLPAQGRVNKNGKDFRLTPSGLVAAGIIGAQGVAREQKGLGSQWADLQSFTLPTFEFEKRYLQILYPQPNIELGQSRNFRFQLLLGSRFYAQPPCGVNQIPMAPFVVPSRLVLAVPLSFLVCLPPPISLTADTYPRMRPARLDSQSLLCC